MKIPFLSEATVDMILRAFSAGGYMLNASDVDQIRTVDPNLSESDRNNLAASFSYGSGGGGGGGSSDRLTSPTDCWVLLDNDNTNPTTPYTNYFSVIKGQSGVPATDPKKMLFSIGSQSGPESNSITASFGPRLDQVDVSDDMGSAISLGAGGDGVTKWTYGTLSAGKTLGVVLQSSLSNTLGMFLQGGNILGIGADSKIVFGRHSLGNVRGGFFNLTTHSRFGVGADLVLNPTDNCLLLEKYSDGSLFFCTPDIATERQFYMFGNYNGATDLAAKWVQFAVGGQPSVAGQDPNQVVIEAGEAGISHLVNNKTTMLVVSPSRGSLVSSCVLRTWHRSSSVPEYTTLVNHHSNIDTAAGTMPGGGLTDRVRLFSVTALDGVNQGVLLATRGDRTTWAYALRSKTAASVGGLDVAEYFDTENTTNTYLPGTVMVTNGAGKAMPSVSYASTAVVGVVTTKPGLLLGSQCELNSKEDPTKDLMSPLAMSGTTPVRVTISHGEIEVGTLLVSDVGGTAAKSPDVIVPGTVVGKALEAFVGPGEGRIKMLVLNC